MTPDTITEGRNRATYKTIIVEPIVPAIGAEITGVDLSAALNASQFQEIHDALMVHQVIFFREQDLTQDELVAFARCFGEPHVNPDTSFGKLDAHPEIEVLDYDASRPP